MRLILLCISMGVLTTISYASDYRWYPNSGSNQGYLEANIQNESGSLFAISCGYFTSDHLAIATWETQMFRLNGLKDVQIVVDNVSYPFSSNFLYMESLNKSSATFEATALAPNVVFKSLVGALIRSKAQKFLIEVPQDGFTETFSLLGAHDVLLGFRFEDTHAARTVPPGHSIVDPCVDK
jgi:hypothetical protein